MTDAAHTPPDDTSFRASLLKQGGGAVAVVAVSALVFWSIGVLGGASPMPTVDQEVAAPDDAEDDEPQEEPEEAEPDVEEDPDPDPEPEPEPEEPDEDTRDDESEDVAPEETEETEGPAPEDDADQEADRTPAIDPGSVSIQVLDGFKADGGAAAGQVADELSAAGYRIVARNQALDYERTTVLFNPGNREAADQIARALGGADVSEQPGNLSTSVDVHVVVGADRA